MSRLIVVPTPLGNLGDITYRAVAALRDASVILAEDTRRTRTLLAHYGITTRLLSYHQHNKLARLPAIAALLQEGDVALVSDAGMPAVADPGFELIEMAVREGIEIDVLPGPSAVITAVVGAALPAPGFLFLGFLPRQSRERRERLAAVASLPYSLVLYEAPYRVLATLRDMERELGPRRVVAARELSKVHQEYRRATLPELIRHWEAAEPRGELTLVVEGGAPSETDETDELLADLRARYEAGEEAGSAIRAVVLKYGVKRNDAYRWWLEVTGKERPE